MKISSIFNFLPTAYAHCDIPCGIYDPHNAQMAAHTVIRMTDLIGDLKKDLPAGRQGEDEKKFVHNLSRYTKVKEEHAEIVKHEIRILWGDYFKDEHIKKYPKLHDSVFKIMKLASQARQGMDKKIAQELLVNVQKIAEIFWQTKDRKTTKIPSFYPSGGELVVPK